MARELSMVERLALAIQAADNATDGLEGAANGLSGDVSDWGAFIARAALAALRDPTAAMVEAGGGEVVNTDRWDDQSFEPRELYRAMIDAALTRGEAS